MKTKLIALASLTALLGTGAYFGAQAQTPVQGTARPVRVMREKREKHPELTRALKALQRAKADLQKADRDFGGHRAKAAQATDAAIQQVREAMAADKN